MEMISNLTGFGNLSGFLLPHGRLPSGSATTDRVVTHSPSVVAKP